jgi:hypothetical protein
MFSLLVPNSVAANFFSITSCDLLEYDVLSSEGGTLGLFKYGHNNMEECSSFSEGAEDETFFPARVGALTALGLGCLLMGLNAVHYFFREIPYKDTVFYALGACIQISLSLIYTIWRNELCDTYGCKMGKGASWNGLAHVMYLAATVISLFIGEPVHNKDAAYSSGRRRKQLELR